MRGITWRTPGSRAHTPTRLIAARAVLLLALGLAACGGDDADAPAAADPDDTAGDTAQAEDEADTEPADDEAEPTDAADDTGATGGEGADDDADDPADGEPIVIGLLPTLTGPTAALGQLFTDGATAAVEHVNAQGGVLDGRPLELQTVDTAGDPTQAASGARQLIQDGVVGIIGSSLSGEFLAEAPIIDEAGIPTLTSATANSIWEAGANPWAFSTGESGDLNVGTAAQYLLDTAGVEEIGIIYEDGAFGQEAAEAAEALLAEEGAEAVAVVNFPPNATDVTGQLNQLQDAGATGLMYWGLGPGLVRTLQGLETLGWEVPTTAPAVIGEAGVRESVGEETLAQAVGVPIPLAFLSDEPGTPGPETTDLTQAFFDRFGQMFGEEKLQGEHLNASLWADGVFILAEAIDRAGSTDPEAIREALESGEPFQVTRGTRTYTPDDHVGITLDQLSGFNAGQQCQGTCAAPEGLFD